MSQRTRAGCQLLLIMSLGSALQAGVVTRRWGTPPKGPPRRAARRPRARPPTGYAAPTHIAPVIDGKLDEAAWTEAPSLSLARTLDGDARAAQPTQVRLLHDAKMLYVAVRCTEAAMDKVRATARGHDGEIWSDDSIEIFLGLGSVYYHFGINAVGSTYDAQAKDNSWNSGMKAAAGRGRREWTLEAAIPLTKIAGEGKLPTQWTASFNRNRYVTGSLQESAWSPTYSGDSHVPERFGRLIFGRPPPEKTPQQRPEPVIKKTHLEILPCEGGEGVIRFDLADLPARARVYRADLRIFRSGPITGVDDEALVNIEIYPLRSALQSGRPPSVGDKPLGLRGPWYDCLDATEAIRQWTSERAMRPKAEFFVKACPRWNAEATCLDVWYEGQAEQVPPQVKQLKAFHRAGQTFLTWKEIEDVVGKDEINWGELRVILSNLDRQRRVRYCVYRSDQPITADTLAEAELIATVRPLSCWNVNARNIARPIDRVIATQDVLMTGQWNPFGQATLDGDYGRHCPIERFVIRQGQPRLPRGTGLYVHTAGQEGKSYYAVLTCVDGVQNAADITQANSLGLPLSEAVGEGEPVLQGALPPSPVFRYPDDRLHYVRWVAPPHGNVPCQYYNWSVAVPKKLGKGVPLELNLHRDNYSYYRTHYRIERDSIVLCPYDFPFRTWWYGYHECHGTLKSFRQGRVHNYTERRLLSFIRWAARKWPVDDNRILVTGCRGGASGSGALQLGLRHGETFALAISGHGLPDYRFVATQMRGRNERSAGDSMQQLWGKVEWALKTESVQTDGAGPAAAPPLRDVWDELNQTKRITEMPAGRELPFVTLTSRHGSPLYRDFYQAMFQTRRPIIAEFSWGGTRYVPVSMSGTYPNNIRLDLRKNRSVLAFKSPAAVKLVAEGRMGGFHESFGWRGDDVVDKPGRYEVTVFWSGRGKGSEGAITLRRLQSFRVTTGSSYRWRLCSLDGKTTVQQGQAVAGEDGLLTLMDVKVAEPRRLIVTPADNPGTGSTEP